MYLCRGGYHRDKRINRQAVTRKKLTAHYYYYYYYYYYTVSCHTPFLPGTRENFTFIIIIIIIIIIRQCPLSVVYLLHTMLLEFTAVSSFGDTLISN
jgi:hypothetical protein